MRRRDFSALLVGAAGWSFVARAQAVKIVRIGFLRLGPPPQSFIEPFRTGLKDLGYVEGQNIRLDFAIAKHIADLPRLAAELVPRVDVLIASGTPAVIPARNATTTVPVIFIAAIDPVATGVVASLARPGGNVTGLSAVFSDLTAKRLELLKELLPSLKRAALLSRPDNPGHAQYVQQMEAAARTLNIEFEIMTATGPDDFEAEFKRVEGIGALVQIDDAMFTAHREKLVELANRYRIPGAYGFRDFVEAGGFVAIGPGYPELYRRSAFYIDKLLKGAQPADLPVELASKFEIILNMKTANHLGLAISPTLVARADQVIE